MNRQIIDNDMRNSILTAWNDKKIATISRLIYLIGIKCNFNIDEILKVTDSIDIDENIISSVLYAFSIFKNNVEINNILQNNEKDFLDSNDKTLQEFKNIYTTSSKINIIDNNIEIINISPISEDRCDDDICYNFSNDKKYDIEFELLIKNRMNYISIDTYQVMIDYKLINGDILNNNEIGEIIIPESKNRRSGGQTIDSRFKTFSNSFHPHIPKGLLKQLNYDINRNKILYISDMPFINEKYSYILATFLSFRKNNNFQSIYDKKLNSLILNEDYKYEKVVQKLVEINNKPYMKYIDIINLLKECFPYANLDKIIDSLIQQKDLVEIENGYYILQEQYPNQAHKVEFVYLMHPKKLGYKKDENELVYNTLNRYFPNSFKNLNSKNLEGFCGRSENLLLWKKGGYFIHKNHILHLVDGYDFGFFIKWLDEELISIPQTSIETFYNTEIETLKKYEINNHHALHSLLELKYPDKYLYPKTPNVARLDSDVENKIQLLLSIMDKDKSYELSELSKAMNTKDSNARLLIDRTDKIVAIKKELYKTRINLVKNEDEKDFNNLLEEIIEYLNNNIEKFIFIYPEHLITKYKSQLHQYLHQYQNTKYVLLDILKKQKKNNKFQVIKNNRIVSKSYLDNDNLSSSISRDLNYHTLIERSLFNNQDLIRSKDLAEFFEIRGYGLSRTSKQLFNN